MVVSHFLRIFFLLLLLVICINACKTEEPNPFPPNNSNQNEDEPLPEISWEKWYLSVPSDRGNGKATSIFYEAIVNNELTEEESEYFYKNADDSYTMYTKFTGFTTSGFSELGDKYCRTELREFWQGNQDVLDNWLMSEGTHGLEVQMQVDFVEENGRTIVAQIHGKESPGLDYDPATVKIRWNNGLIQIDYYVKPDDGELWTSAFDEKLDFGRVDNEKFIFRMKIINGKLFCALECEAKDLFIPLTEIYNYVENGYEHENYFKTGNYFGWNDDYEAAAQVKLYYAVTSHE